VPDTGDTKQRQLISCTHNAKGCIWHCNRPRNNLSTLLPFTHTLSSSFTGFSINEHRPSTMAAYYTFEDYSGTSTPNKSDNPYDGLIEACDSDPVRIPLFTSNLQESPDLSTCLRHANEQPTYSNASKPLTKPTEPTATRNRKPSSSPPTSPA